MGKYDKDRHQKQLAIRYCLAQGIAPCLEVQISSSADLSDSAEVLTDIDVLGIEFVVDGGLRRFVFDCKTTNKMSPVNRAFWAAGLKAYAGCDEAFVILKSRAVYNHRLSALSIGVDLHDESSFEDLGESRQIGFNSDYFYQSAVDRWNDLFDAFAKNPWSEELYLTSHNLAPLSGQPWKTFRRLISDARAVRGQIDPSKSSHLAIYVDVLSAFFILWTSIGRDVRRFYDPKMAKGEFEKALRYYIWGGKESYQIRAELRQRSGNGAAAQDFPAWDKLVSFAGLVISGPNALFGCINICRELALRTASGSLPDHDKNLSRLITENGRARQFILGASEYLVSACGLPTDLTARMQQEVANL